MDMIEQQLKRRKRGMAVIALSMIFLMNAIRFATADGVRALDFMTIYSSGMALGAGMAVVVASFRIMREIAGK